MRPSEVNSPHKIDLEDQAEENFPIDSKLEAALNAIMEPLEAFIEVKKSQYNLVVQ